MIITGRFIAEAPYITATISNPHFAGGVVRFLVDTGASRTLLQDVDFRRLRIPPSLLMTAPSQIVGVGGSVPPSLVHSVNLDFPTTTGGTYTVYLDIWVLPPLNPGLSLPSVLGRDVLNRFEFKYDFRYGTVQLEL